MANPISRCIKFREGLRPIIRSQLAPFSFTEFHELFSAAQCIENDILRNTEERKRYKNSGKKKKTKRMTIKRQCKDKDCKGLLLVAVVGLLEVVVSCPMLVPLVVRLVIINGSV